jgi:hypothetical protein
LETNKKIKKQRNFTAKKEDAKIDGKDKRKQKEEINIRKL